MLKQISMLALATAILASPAAFASSAEEAEAKCKQYAQEDQVPAEEMKEYLAECIQSLAESGSQEDK